MLHVDGSALDQTGAMTTQRTDGADIAVGAKRGPKQAYRVQVLQPPAIAHVRLASGHMLDMLGVDQADTDASLLQYLVRGKPVDAGRFHGYGSDTALNQPSRHLTQILGECF
jgi:hypothetical protein